MTRLNRRCYSSRLMTTATEKPRDFRQRLQEELLDRCRKNRRYSLRAFAQALRVPSSDLSKILHGKRGISDTMLTHLAKRLDLEPEDIERYRAANSAKRARKGAKAADGFETLTLDAFHIISDWYPLAILEMTKVEGFVPSADIIARRLGVTVSEVTIAVERLMRLGMLEVKDDGTMVDLAGSTSAATGVYTDLAKRKYQKQILQKALAAVDDVPVEKRSQSSMLMAVNTAKLADARDLIKDFRRRLCALLEDGPRDQVMFLSVSLFPVLDSFYDIGEL